MLKDRDLSTSDSSSQQKKIRLQTELYAHPLDLQGEGRRIRSTTVACVRRGDAVVMAADGQVSLGATVMKHSAKKIRRLYQDKVLAGFAGSTADAFSLFSRFETKLEQYAGNLGRAAVELAKDWRTGQDAASVRGVVDRGVIRSQMTDALRELSAT